MAILQRSKRARLGAVDALVALDRVVKGDGDQNSKLARALAVLKALSRKEAIPLAIVGRTGRSIMDMNVTQRMSTL